jgi:hypothetical protein
LSFEDTCVSLRSGPIIPVDAYRLLLELEERGYHLRRKDETLVVVTPADKPLTDADCARVRQWKWHLLMLIDYSAPADALSAMDLP